jgi:putative membrane protein
MTSPSICRLPVLAVSLLFIVVAGPGCSDDAKSNDGGRRDTGTSRDGGGEEGGPGGNDGAVGGDAADATVDAAADGAADRAATDATADGLADRADAADAAMDGTAAGDGASDGAASLNDAQVAGVMLEANGGEAQAGQVATTRATAGVVQAFAQRMIDEHGMANRRLGMLLDQLGLSPADSTTRRALGMQAHDAVDMLWAAPAARFDVAYMESQVAMHAMVLTLIDTMLLPSATNASLRSELMAMRMTVVTHLSDARIILLSVTADGGADTGPADSASGDVGQSDAGADGP